MKVLILLMFSGTAVYGQGFGGLTHFPKPKSGETSSLLTEYGRKCEKAMNAAISACQRAFEAKTQGDAAIAQNVKAGMGAEITQAGTGLVTGASQMSSITIQTKAICESAYHAYWNQCHYSSEDLKKMQKWPHKVSRDKANHDLPEVEKMQARAQSIFSGMGEQLAATGASEMQAISGANETLNTVAGGNGVAASSSEKFPGCAAGISGEKCAEELTKRYNGDRGASASLQSTQPVQNTQPFQQPAQEIKADTYDNGPKTLDDCRSGSPSGWSGTDACTKFLNTFYNRGFGSLPAAAPAATTVPAKNRKPSSKFYNAFN